MKISCFLYFSLVSIFAISQTTPISEEKFVPVGGIEQWVTIKGNDRSKPVILFLHGGPGSVMSPYDQVIYGGWEEDFILVNWDQRGAGRTFGRNAPAEVTEEYWIANPLTVDQMVADGIQLAEYLLESLGKKKIILIGTSWGSILGAKMALLRPDLFYAYIGHSQIVNLRENLTYAYHKVYQLAKEADDKESIEKLERVGIPPYDDAMSSGKVFRIIKKYEKENSIPAPATWWALAPEYDNEKDIKHRYDGDDYSFLHFVGHKKLGIESMGAKVDLMKEDLEFKIPVYLIQGEADILTSKEITTKYFNKITAPEKELFLLPGAAHGHNQLVVDTQYKIVKEYLDFDK